MTHLQLMSEESFLIDTIADMNDRLWALKQNKAPKWAIEEAEQFIETAKRQLV